MEVLVFLVPLALTLGAIGLMAGAGYRTSATGPGPRGDNGVTFTPRE